MLNDLTALEEQVVEAARSGDWAEPDRVRAELVRDLLMGRHGELDPRGLRLRGAHVAGRLDLDHVTAVTGLTLTDCVLDQEITCTQARLRNVSLSGSRLPGLRADKLRTDGDLDLTGVVASGSTGRRGLVRLAGAHIGGNLDLDGAEITNIFLPVGGPALYADGVRTDGAVSLFNATITGMGDLAAVRLLDARIGGQLILERATITNDTGPGLAADGLHTDSGVFLGGVKVTGQYKRGAVRLDGAHIAGGLNLDRAEITNDTGPSLAATGMQTTGDVFARDAVLRGTVQLAKVRVGGSLFLDRTRIDSTWGPLIRLSDTQITGALALPSAVVCEPGGERQISVRGLDFPALEGVTWREWLHLLTHHTAEYVPQPYQQLAAVERASGHDGNAREILIAQQEDLRRRAPAAIGGRVALARHWLWGQLGRYGYRAHRLFVALALVLVLAGGLGYVAGQVPTRPGHHAAERVTSGACSTAELIGLGIDRGLPLGATGLRARCDLDTGSVWGQVFTYVIWVLQALMWALATLAVAAYTGLIRKLA